MILLDNAMALTQIIYTAPKHVLGILGAIACTAQHGGRIWAVRAMQWRLLLLASVLGWLVARTTRRRMTPKAARGF